jgi:hypothetical protein
MADDEGARTLTEHVENIRTVWADVKRVIRAELRKGGAR